MAWGLVSLTLVVGGVWDDAACLTVDGVGVDALPLPETGREFNIIFLHLPGIFFFFFFDTTF